MTDPRDSFYGRTELQWEELEAVGWELLLECRTTLTNYTDLNNDLARITGQAPWNFQSPADRDAMGELLGRLADRSYSECVAAKREPVMISALCKFLNENDAGDGFYRKAVMLNLITPAMYKSKLDRFGWWATHVGEVQEWLAER